MKKLITLLLVPVLLPPAFAQEVQKCCGSSSSTFLLGSTNYARHTQCLYAPGELAGATAGYISRLYFRYGVSGIAAGNTLGNLSIALLQTPATSFADEQFLTGLDTIRFPGTLTIAPGVSGNWFSIDLDEPFAFDPTLSLVVDINFETSANTAFGTMSQSNVSGRKIMSSSSSATVGESWDTLQDFGFDMATAGMEARVFPDLRVFPNPSAGPVELAWKEPLQAPVNLSLLDPVGRVVGANEIPVGATRTVVDLGNLAPGVYLLAVQDEMGILFSRRLVRE